MNFFFEWAHAVFVRECEQASERATGREDG
jgi:hypothetical protein